MSVYGIVVVAGGAEVGLIGFTVAPSIGGAQELTSSVVVGEGVAKPLASSVGDMVEAAKAGWGGAAGSGRSDYVVKAVAMDVADAFAETIVDVARIYAKGGAGPAAGRTVVTMAALSGSDEARAGRYPSEPVLMGKVRTGVVEAQFAYCDVCGFLNLASCPRKLLHRRP